MVVQKKRKPNAPKATAIHAAQQSGNPNASWGAIDYAVLYYSVACYRTFDQLGDTESLRAARFAGDWSMEYPLWLRDEKTSEFPTRDIPGFGVRSSIFAIAIQSAYLVWVQKKAGNDISFPDSHFVRDALAGWDLAKIWKQD